MNKILLALSVVYLSFFANKAPGQWRQTEGPPGGWVTAFTECGDSIFAGVMSHGVFLSTDHGRTWSATGLITGTANALAVMNNSLFAGMSNSGACQATPRSRSA